MATALIFNSCNVYNRTIEIVDGKRTKKSNRCEVHDNKMRKRIGKAYYALVSYHGSRETSINYEESPNAYFVRRVGAIPVGERHHLVIDYVCRKCRKIRKEAERIDKQNWERKMEEASQGTPISNVNELQHETEKNVAGFGFNATIGTQFSNLEKLIQHFNLEN